MARIYVSSTFSDLEDYRKKVSVAIRRLGHEDIVMEYYIAEDKRPLDRSLETMSLFVTFILASSRGVTATFPKPGTQNRNPSQNWSIGVPWRPAKRA